jgi:hypothetical protein
LDVPFLPKFGELIPLQPMLVEHEEPLPFILFAYAPVDRNGAETITVSIARTIEAKRQPEIHRIPNTPSRKHPKFGPAKPNPQRNFLKAKVLSGLDGVACRSQARP